MDKLLKKLNIDETMTKKPKIKQFDHVKDNIPLIEDYNFMADLLILPKTPQGHSMLLVVVDLATDEFDIEPLKNKDSETVLNAMFKMFKRPHLSKPFASIKTDEGKEFKGVFSKWLYNESILHLVAVKDRHRQMGNVETLNKQLGRIIIGYLNSKEKATGKRFTNWTSILPIIRDELNKLRKKTIKDTPFDHMYDHVPAKVLNKEPKYNVGDIVYHVVETPHDALGKIKNQGSNNFRMGDYRFSNIPKKIKQVLVYHAGYRYILDNVPNVSYMEQELLPADENDAKFEVKKIIDKKKINNKIYYKVHWKNHLKKDATWEPKTELIKDGLKDLIEDYEQQL